MKVTFIVCTTCLLWIMYFVLWGASRSGKDFFANLSEYIMGDSRGAIPLLFLAIPSLTIASLASLSKLHVPKSYCCFSVSALVRCLIFFVTSVFGVSCVTRHLTKLGGVSLESLDANEVEDLKGYVIKGIANGLGMTSMIAMSFFLIPVSKQGPILKSLGWSKSFGIRIHYWFGQVLSVCSFGHGILYLFRWNYVLKNTWGSLFQNSMRCWGFEIPYDQRLSQNSENHTCYENSIILTGILGLLALAILLVFSSSWVRRGFYRIFFLVHVSIAPLFVLMVILHFDLGLLYLSPSILYYIGTSLPVIEESRGKLSTKLAKVEIIGGKNECKYLSLTFEATGATMKAFRPGMFTYLSAPSISSIRHPFTINRVPGQATHLRVIIKATGHFTRELIRGFETGLPPQVFLDNLHGCPLEDSSKSDKIAVVAGGIGITPYLSLASSNNVHEDGDFSQNGTPLQFLWICRDWSLIQYIKTEYFSSSEMPTPFVADIFHTGTSTDAEILRMYACTPSSVPFDISEFAAMPTASTNLKAFTAHALYYSASLIALWFLYMNLNTTQAIAPRLLPLGAVALIGVVTFRTLEKLFKCHSDYFTNCEGYFGKLASSNKETNPLFDPSVQLYTDEESQASFNLIQERQGRPDMDAALGSLLDAEQPVIFLCGPRSLSDKVKSAVGRLGKVDDIPSVSICEEEFEF